MKKAESKSESGTILVANGEEAVCNVVRQALEAADYRVLEIHDAVEALEICRRPMERIDLLLTEVKVCGVSGRAFVEKTATLRPRMKVIYMSRNVDLLLSEGVLTPDMVYLRKPFTGTELLAKVWEVLGSVQSCRQIPCPRCSSMNVRRSRRRWLDWLPPLILVAPYRCRDCRTRFFRFGYLSGGHNAAQVH
jgi:DNA-binding NtrC family response regulator